MTSKRLFLILVAGLASSAIFGQTMPQKQPATNNAAITGVWRGDADGLPAVVINISDETGKLSGAVLFYFHKRENANAPWISTPGIPEPLFGIAQDGDTLRFEVSHRRVHPPGSLHDAPVRFRLTVTAPGRAQLSIERSSPEKAGPPLMLLGSDY